MLIYNILLIVQIIVALSIIGLVLIQHGKGADAGAAFGGGASGTVFGSRGSGNFLTRSTAVLAAVFFANSLLLAWIVAHRDGPSASTTPQSVVTQEVVQEEKPKEAPTAPSTPSDVPTTVGDSAQKEPAATSENADVPADVPSK